MGTEKRISIHQEFIDKLNAATGEDKQVNPAYVRALERQLPRIKTVGGGYESNSTEFGNLDKNNGNHEIICEIDTLHNIYPNIETDGVYEVTCSGSSTYRTFLLQLECKLDVDFNNAREKAKVILQVCCYLKQIKYEQPKDAQTWRASSIPRVVVLGSKINCLALPTSILFTHADKAIKGYKSASTAHLNKDNAQILADIIDDIEIYNYSIVRETSDKNCVKLLCEQILRLGNELKITDDLTEHTMSLAFDFFDMYVLDEKVSKKLSSREKVDIFIGTFFNEEFEEIKTNRHATSYDKLRIHGIEVKVDPDKYNQFKVLFAMRDYGMPEQKKITAITCRLIEDTDRRRKGDFYTPSIWVDEAHKLLDKNLGENWREEYMVWDCAWGTGNLTRDYKFDDLYCSTLQKEDLNIGYRYNRGACKFQYDFLNDDVEEFERVKDTLIYPFINKRGINIATMRELINLETALDLYAMAVDKNIITIEEGKIAYSKAINIIKSTKLYQEAPGLINGLLGIDGKDKKKLLFLINPPYATTGNIDMKGNKETGLADNIIAEYMDDMGGCTQQLYAQFIFRISEIARLFSNEVILGIYCPTVIFTGKHFAKMRASILNNSFMEGFMFQASQFANVADDWSIAFSLWNFNHSKSNDYLLDAKDLSSIDNNGIVTIREKKRMYSSAGKEIQKIIKNEKCASSKEVYTMSSGLVITDKIYKQPDNCMGYLFMDTPRVGYNTRFVTLINRRMKGNKIAISLDNKSFTDACVIYTVRKLISGQYSLWMNNSDEYMVPNESDTRYEQFKNDSLIYSTFHIVNNFTSLRKITDAHGIRNIQNEFFWLSYKEMENIAGGMYSSADVNTQVEDDIEEFGKERFVYKKLQEVTLSPDAQAVLDKATKIVKKSFKYRKDFNQKHPEYHINTWDAGWYQIKGMCNEYPELKKDLEEFSELYKAFEDRMRPLVYELGFLYK